MSVDARTSHNSCKKPFHFSFSVHIPHHPLFIFPPPIYCYHVHHLKSSAQHPDKNLMMWNQEQTSQESSSSFVSTLSGIFYNSAIACWATPQDDAISEALASLDEVDSPQHLPKPNGNNGGSTKYYSKPSHGRPTIRDQWLSLAVSLISF